jgi:hypothetical protein
MEQRESHDLNNNALLIVITSQCQFNFSQKKFAHGNEFKTFPFLKKMKKKMEEK